MSVYKILFIVSLLVIESFIEAKQVNCASSSDNRKKICYYQRNRGCAQFESCQQTICIADRMGNCQETTFKYDEQECLQNLCHFNANEGSIQECISQLAGTQSDFISNIQYVIITLILLFIAASILLKIKHSILSRQHRIEQEQDDNQFQENQSLNGFVRAENQNDSSQVTHAKRIQIQRKKRKRFLKKFNPKQQETDLNLGFINKKTQEVQEMQLEQNQICCICLNSNHINCVTACGHLYHSKCLTEWLKIKQFCPSCRNSKLFPVKIFCTSCDKIRDIFRIDNKNYFSFSNLVGEYFSTFYSCIQCVEKHPLLQNITQL